jgi:hypothetical protein
MARQARRHQRSATSPAFMLEYDAGGPVDFAGVGLMTTSSHNGAANTGPPGTGIHNDQLNLR